MKTILYLLQKEFIQIFRDKVMLPLIFVVPVIQLVVLVYAATLDMKNIKLEVVDMDNSVYSRKMINKFEGSPFFIVKKSNIGIIEAENQILKNKANAILLIPHNLEKNILNEKKAGVQLLINAINTTEAQLSYAYMNSVLADFNKTIVSELINVPTGIKASSIEIIQSYWYNPKMNYKIYMVPGILVILVTIIGGFLTALNIVREKESGTIEQINVTPIKKHQFLIGKLVPFWCIALFELAFGLTLGKFIFHVPIIGSLWLLFGFASIYLIVVLGIGLFISTITNSQQQVMFYIYFFLLIFILMSGIFTPSESMPRIARKINIINPFYYFMKAIRMILLKGSGLADVLPEIYSLSIYAVTIFSLALFRHKKVS